MRSIRYHVTQAALYLAFLLLIIVSAVIVYYFWREGNTNRGISFNHLTFEYSTLKILFLIFFYVLIAFTAGLLFRNLFKKTVSPEIFFFSLAVLTLSFTSLRSLLLLEELNQYSVNLPEAITRIVYFGKIITALFLFTSGLFSTGISLQNQESLLLLTLLIAFVLASALPINVFETNILLLKGSASQYGINMVFTVLQICAVLNFIMGAVKNNDSDYLYLALGVVLTTVGSEILFRLIPDWISIAGFLFLISGTAIFGYKIHKIYLWS